MSGAEIPTSGQLRWPILVVLDQGAGEDPILELPERVASQLDLAPEAADVLDPDTGRPLLTERLLQAIADLHQAGAVDGSDDASRLWISRTGRLLTEVDAEELPDADVEAQMEAVPTGDDRDPVLNWVGALLELFFPI
jgi:hypothetical protein